MTRLTEAQVIDQGCRFIPVGAALSTEPPWEASFKDSPFVATPEGKMLVGPANCRLMVLHRLLYTSTFAQLPMLAVVGGHELVHADVFAIADVLAANCGYEHVVASLPKGAALGTHESAGPHSIAATALRAEMTWGQLDASSQNNISLSDVVARLLDAGHDVDAIADFQFFYSKPFVNINLPVLSWETFIPDPAGGHYGWRVPSETVREVAQALADAMDVAQESRPESQVRALAQSTSELDSVQRLRG